MSDLHKLYQKIGYHFKDAHLLEAALSHRSIGDDNYERLEFLGDSALNFIITAELFCRYPKTHEGELSRFRASLVNGISLAALAQEFKLGDYLRLGLGELRSGGFQRRSILADALEAIIGAIYLDAGFMACQQIVLNWFSTRLNNVSTLTIPKDPKTQLQEYLQAHKMALPNYKVISVKGEAHSQIFHIQCTIDEVEHKTEGRDSSRRAAEQQAAKKMLMLLQ
jgi:ribonuclease-3